MVSDRRVDVVLEAEWLDDGSCRIHLIGVFTPGASVPAQRYDSRNVVQTWEDVDHNVGAMLVFPEVAALVTEGQEDQQ